VDLDAGGREPGWGRKLFFEDIDGPVMFIEPRQNPGQDPTGHGLDEELGDPGFG
jgi:hypothetical protein